MKKSINKKWLGLILTCIVVLGCIGYEGYKISKIRQVTGGHLNNYPNVTVGEVFAEYIGDEEWSYTKEDGIEKVKVTGDIMYLDEESHAEVTFKLNKDDTFRVMSFKIDGEPMSKFILGVFISDVYDEYNKYN